MSLHGSGGNTAVVGKFLMLVVSDVWKRVRASRGVSKQMSSALGSSQPFHRPRDSRAIEQKVKMVKEIPKSIAGNGWSAEGSSGGTVGEKVSRRLRADGCARRCGRSPSRGFIWQGLLHPRKICLLVGEAKVPQNRKRANNTAISLAMQSPWSAYFQ